MIKSTSNCPDWNLAWRLVSISNATSTGLMVSGVANVTGVNATGVSVTGIHNATGTHSGINTIPTGNGTKLNETSDASTLGIHILPGVAAIGAFVYSGLVGF
jgi:hypothetical protein